MAGVIEMGRQTLTQGKQGLKVAAGLEEYRNRANDQLEAAERQAKTTGALSGAAIGAKFGPWGALIGFVVGYIAGDGDVF